MNSSQIGNIGEVKVLSEFVKLGIPCYLPYGDGNLVDLIAEFNGKLNKIQIKTTQRIGDNCSMSWKITRQEGYHGNRIQYQKDSIDYFALYCVESDVVCLIPFDENIPSSNITIKSDDYKGIRTSSMRFAKDYQIKNFIIT